MPYRNKEKEQLDQMKIEGKTIKNKAKSNKIIIVITKIVNAFSSIAHLQ